MSAFLDISSLFKLKESYEITFDKKDIPFPNSKIVLYDFFLSYKKGAEEKYYANHQILLDNIRRGNSIIDYFDEKEEKKIRTICRRGLKKFFILGEEHIFHARAQEKVDQRIMDHTYHDIEKAINNKEVVTIYELEKANGENCQISYVEPLQSWIIASKNQSILLRKENDILLYTENIPLLKKIGRTWFKILSQLNEAEIEQLKLELNKGLNLIGEFCGNKDHQTLVPINEENIFFFAIVNINSFDTCIAPPQAISFFQNFKLSHVKIIYTKIIQKSNLFYDELMSIYEKVASQSLDKNGEGSVLYFTGKDAQNNERTLSLCKIKSLEYKIFKTIRMVFYRIKRKDKVPKNLLNFLDNQLEKIVKHCKAYREINFYKEIAHILAEEMTSLNNNKFYKEVMNNFKLYIDKAINKIESKSEAKILDFKIDPQVQNEEKQENKKKDEKLVYVLLPMGIPNMGKSSFLKNSIFPISKEKGFETYSISTDEIRGNLIEEVKKRNPGKSLDQDFLMDKTRKSSDDEFLKELKSISNKIKHSKESKHLFFIDKNHPPNALKKTISCIESILKGYNNIKLFFIGVVPSCKESIKLGYKNFPFSSDFVLSCMARSIFRKEHETLSGEPLHVIGIIFFFVTLYGGVKFSEELALNNGLNYIIDLPFVREEKASTNFNAKTIESFNQTLKNYSQKYKESKELNYFVEVLQNEIEEKKNSLELMFNIDQKFFDEKFRSEIERMDGGRAIEDEEENWIEEDFDMGEESDNNE